MALPRLDLTELQVLIAEDNPHMRQILRMLLSGFGIRAIYEAEDGASALEIMKTRDPDIMLIDWVMPILDGADLTRLIRRGPAPACFVPIIAITSHTERQRILSARDSGVTEVICKPVSAQALYLRMASCILSPRDFVRAASFIGPDRRRFEHRLFSGTERRNRLSLMDEATGEPQSLDDTSEVKHSRPSERQSESTLH